MRKTKETDVDGQEESMKRTEEDDAKSPNVGWSAILHTDALLFGANERRITMSY